MREDYKFVIVWDGGFTETINVPNAQELMRILEHRLYHAQQMFLSVTCVGRLK